VFQPEGIPVQIACDVNERTENTSCAAWATDTPARRGELRESTTLQADRPIDVCVDGRLVGTQPQRHLSR
jgi:hypothetical protein